MYQNGSGHPTLSSLTSSHSTLNMAPPTSTSTSPYSHESLASSFMHSGSTPVYVPTNRPSLHSSHMSAYGVGSGAAQTNSSTLSGTPTGTSMWQTDNLGMTYSTQTTPSRFGFSSPQSGQIMTSDTAAVAAAAYAGSSLPRTPTALNPYSSYMRADFNAWSNFSNMALQGFKQTVDHDLNRWSVIKSLNESDSGCMNHCDVSDTPTNSTSSLQVRHNDDSGFNQKESPSKDKTSNLPGSDTAREVHSAENEHFLSCVRQQNSMTTSGPNKEHNDDVNKDDPSMTPMEQSTLVSTPVSTLVSRPARKNSSNLRPVQLFPSTETYQYGYLRSLLFHYYQDYSMNYINPLLLDKPFDKIVGNYGSFKFHIKKN